MNLSARCWTCGLLCLGGSAQVAVAQGPSWAFAEYGHVSARLQADESGEGQGGQITLPLSRSWFVSAAADDVDAHFDDPSVPIAERITRFSGGLGVHSTGTRSHMFALLSYAAVTERMHFTDGSSPDRRERHEGVVFAMGVRGLLKPYLSLEPELGLGYFGDDGSLEEFVRVKLALRVLPRLWLVGGFSSGLILADDYTGLAGARLSWSDATPRPRRLRGARILTPDGQSVQRDPALAIGTSMVVLRPLRLQQKPLAGAAEIHDVPAGAVLVLEDRTQNDFGIWWRVAVDNRHGWIREKELQ